MPDNLPDDQNVRKKLFNILGITETLWKGSMKQMGLDDYYATPQGVLRMPDNLFRAAIPISLGGNGLPLCESTIYYKQWVTESSVDTNDNEALLDRDLFVEFVRTKILKRSSAYGQILSAMGINRREQGELVAFGAATPLILGRHFSSERLKKLLSLDKITLATLGRIVEYQVWCRRTFSGAADEQVRDDAILRILLSTMPKHWAQNSREFGHAMRVTQEESFKPPFASPVTIGQIRRMRGLNNNYPSYLCEGRLCIRVKIKCVLTRFHQRPRKEGNRFSLYVRDCDGDAQIEVKWADLDPASTALMHACRRGEKKHLIIYGTLMPKRWDHDSRGFRIYNDDDDPIMMSADIFPCKMPSEVYSHSLYCNWLSQEYKLRTTLKEKVWQFIIGCTHYLGRGMRVANVEVEYCIDMMNGLHSRADILNAFKSLVQDGLIVDVYDDKTHVRVTAILFMEVANVKFERQERETYSSVATKAVEFVD